MAIDVCSDIPSSPRISFSHDLNQPPHLLLHDHHRRRLDPPSDFDFCTDDFTFQISSADELFSQGRILPAEIKPKDPALKLPDLSPVTSIEKPSRIFEKPSGVIEKPSSAIDKSSRLIVGKPRSTAPEKKTEPKKVCSLKELLSASPDEDEGDDENGGKSRRNHKSFWQFRRSTSLNLEKIKSLHFISRSNSTGSGPNPGLQRQKSVNYRRTTSFSGTSRHCYSYGKGGVSPVLNLPQPYIAKVTVGFFGIGSLFCKGKHRKKKK